MKKYFFLFKALKNSGQKLWICVRHEPQPSGLKKISFCRKPGEKMGISICGGINSPSVILSDPTDEGIFIEHVDKNSFAGECIDLKAGLRVLEVNDDSLLGCTKNEAADLLRSAPEIVNLLVCDGFIVGQVTFKYFLFFKYYIYLKNGSKYSIANSPTCDQIPYNLVKNNVKDDLLYKLQNGENIINKKNSYNSVSTLFQKTPFTQSNENNLSQVTRFSSNLNSITNIDSKKTSPPTVSKSVNHQREFVSFFKIYFLINIFNYLVTGIFWTVNAYKQ